MMGWWAKPAASIGPSNSASKMPARAVTSSPYRYSEAGSSVWQTTSSSGSGVGVGTGVLVLAAVALGRGVADGVPGPGVALAVGDGGGVELQATSSAARTVASRLGRARL